MAVVVVFWLLLLANRIEWSHHLVGDVEYYFRVVHGTYETLLYPPAANFLFGLLPSSSFGIYLTSLFAVNSILILTLAWLYQKISGKTAKHQLLFLLLFAGPLVLFRFDLLLIFLLVVSLFFFQKGRYLLSGLFLGAATAVKIFPAIILPYLLILLLKNRGNFFKLLTAFTLVVAISILGPGSATAMFGFHLSKLVHIESVPGTILTMAAYLRYGKILPIEFVNGSFGLPFYYTLGHPRIFSYLPILVLGLIYPFLPRKFDLHAIIFLIFVLILTTPVLSPQYLLWPILLLPLLTKPSPFLILTSAIILILTQDVYPIHYDGLIWHFYQGGGEYSEIFWVLAFRNLLVLILTGRIAAGVFRWGQ